MPAASDEGLSLVVATARYAAWKKWMAEDGGFDTDPYKGFPVETPVHDAMHLADAYLKSIGKYPLEVRVPAIQGEWGHLPNEPCRFCFKAGGVHFMDDKGPEGRDGIQPVRCDKCGRSWQV